MTLAVHLYTIFIMLLVVALPAYVIIKVMGFLTKTAVNTTKDVSRHMK